MHVSCLLSVRNVIEFYLSHYKLYVTKSLLNLNQSCFNAAKNCQCQKRVKAFGNNSDEDGATDNGCENEEIIKEAMVEPILMVMTRSRL